MARKCSSVLQQRLMELIRHFGCRWLADVRELVVMDHVYVCYY